MEESYICPNCGSIGFSRDIICPQCGHRSARSGGGSKLPIFIGGVVVGIIAAVGAVFASGGFSGDSLPVAPVSSPIDTDIETTKTSEIPTATLTPSLTDIPTPTLGMVVTYDLPQFSNQPSPKSCPGCNLTGADLTGADLRETNLTGAVLRGANLTGAELTSAFLKGAILDGVIGADFTGAWEDWGKLIIEP